MDFSKKSSKQKAMTELSKYEAADQKVRLPVIIEKRNIDGETITVARIDRCEYPEIAMNGGKETVEKKPVPKEFTNMDDFGEYLKEIVKEISGKL